MELAQANYDNIVRNLKAVTSAAGDTERAISKTMNRASESSNAKNSILTAIAASGASKMLGDTALNGSAFGSKIGSLASSTLSSIASGAAL